MRFGTYDSFRLMERLETGCRLLDPDRLVAHVVGRMSHNSTETYIAQPA